MPETAKLETANGGRVALTGPVRLEVKLDIHIRDAQALLMLLRRERRSGFVRRGEESLPEGAVIDLIRLHEYLERSLLMRRDA